MILLISQAYSQICHEKAQRSQFKTLKTLAHTDQMLQAIDLVQEKLQIQSGYANISNTIYNITKFQVQLQYSQYAQEGSIFPGTPNAVRIAGGVLNIDYRYNYYVNASGQVRSGLGLGRTVVQPFQYVKRLLVSQGSLQWDLYSYTPLNDSIKFQTVKTTPDNQQDMKIIDDQILNVAQAGIRINVLNNINANLNQTFESILNNQKLISKNFNYSYRPSSRVARTVSYYASVFDREVSSKGLYFSSAQEIVDYNGTECGEVPNQPLSVSAFGGDQIFFSMEYFKSSLKYALQQGWLDTVLDHNWQTQVFQFYIGDLNKAMTGLDNYQRDAEANGSCTFNSAMKDKLQISRQDTVSLIVKIPYSCKLSLPGKLNILDPLNLQLQFIVKPVLTQHYFDMIIKQANFLVQNITLGPGLSIRNNALFMYYVDNMVQTLLGKRAFGSGFNMVDTFRTPGVYVNSRYIMFFDQSAP